MLICDHFHNKDTTFTDLAEERKCTEVQEESQLGQNRTCSINYKVALPGRRKTITGFITA